MTLHLLRSAACAAAALTLAACQVMNSTQSFLETPDGRLSQTCSSGLGSYALPYSTIKVKVSQNFLNNEPVSGTAIFIDTQDPKRHPDPKQRYCLNFLESGFSDDTVGVYYGNASAKARNNDSNFSVDPDFESANSNGLLSLIISKNVDRSGETILKLLRAIFIFISPNPNFNFNRENEEQNATPKTLTEQDVDPFNLQALANLNNDLRPYGFCITLGDYTHDASLSPGDYCNKPGRALAESGLPQRTVIAGRQHRLVDPLPIGVFYRPRQPYTLFVYGRSDPEMGGPWQLIKTDTVMLENISPVLAVQVHRALFAEHRVALAFDNGNLLDICIAKGSELRGFVKIPLSIVYGIVSLPSQTIEAELSLAGNKQDLLDAQDKVITAQKSYIDSLLNQSADSKTGAKPTASKLTDSAPNGGPNFFKDGGGDVWDASKDDVVARIPNDKDNNRFPPKFCKLIEGE
jgi:hypothetical protein